MKRKNYLILSLSLLLCMGNQTSFAATGGKKKVKKEVKKLIPTGSDYVIVKGENLIKPDGSKLYIVGTNLGNWLNPEGYMFNFKKTNCEWMINGMICQLAGPDFARAFLAGFQGPLYHRR